MSLTLYHGEPNGPSLTVLAALFEKGLDADLVRIDLANGERHGSLCPHTVEIDMSIEGEGPILVADGQAMADSVFIACYLDDVGNGAVLRPADPYARWQVMMWCRQIIERSAPACALLGCEANLSVGEGFELATITSEDLRARWQEAVSRDYCAEQIIDSKTKVLQAVVKCEAQLVGREWLMGEFSIADLETYGWLAGMVAVVPTAFENAPRTQSWLARVKARPSVARALGHASMSDPSKSWAPGPEINRWG